MACLLNGPHFPLNHDYGRKGNQSPELLENVGGVGGFLEHFLVGDFNPFEKYVRQIGNLPQVWGENKKSLSCHHLVFQAFPFDHFSPKFTTLASVERLLF